uniref:Uncharacterized protein n=1 Tax=Globodera rostochiensis TaxID=31243 RepID=A0A914GV51_GLORO
MNNSSENSLLQFERLEKQLNGSAKRGAPPDQRQPRNQPSIQEVDDDDGGEAHDQTLQLPSHEAFMRQGMADGEAEDGSDVPVELSYQRLLQNSPSIISSGSTERQQLHSSTHSSPAPRPSSLSASRAAPKTTPRTSSTTTLMAPLKVPDFKQSELRPPPSRPLQPPPPPLSVQKARPMFQSTPHNKKQLLKPTTPGGHQISPIPEEGELDLDRLVSALLDDQQQQQQQVATTAASAADQRAVTSLITQLRDVIAQWDWAKARHRHVEKIYFERQTEEQDARWEQLNAEISKFNERKADEWAQIAKVRAELHAEREKRMGKKDADRLKELEQELTKLKSKDALGSQRASEWRTRVRELEGEVRVREQSYTDNIMRIKKLERQLVTAEQENSNLRTRLTLLRSEVAKKKQQEEHQQQQHQHARKVPAAAAPQPPSSNSNSTTNSQHHQQQQLDQNQQQLVAAHRPTPFRMINGPRDRTAAAVHQTVTNTDMGGDVVVTELVSCRRTMPTTTGRAGRGDTVQQHALHRCMLYEWPSTRNFRWTSDGTAHRTSGESVQIDYLHAERLYEVRMPRGHLLRFLLSGQLELHWANGDRTLVLPDNERRELFSPEQPNFRMEIFMPTGVAYRLIAQTQWQREAFVPDSARMSARADGSFVAEHVEERQPKPADRGDGLLGRPSLQINSPDFQLRRFADTKAVKLALDRRAGVQLWLCTDNVLLVKHVFKPVAVAFNNTPAQKCVCFSYGRCRHINTNNSNNGTTIANNGNNG